MSESSRLQTLRDLIVLDSLPEQVFDSLAKLASQVCGTSIALISLVDQERQWFKANVGLPGINQTPRDSAFCSHAILNDGILVVPDATLDPLFENNPLVTGEPGIRFYAGSPLILPNGERVGTLCVIDRQTRQLSPSQYEMLRSLAAIASQTLVMRRDLINRSISTMMAQEAPLLQSEALYRNIVEEQSELVSLAWPDGQLVYVNQAYARHFELEPSEMIGKSLFNFIEPADLAVVQQQIQNVLQTGRSLSGENRMIGPDGHERWVAWTNSIQHDSHHMPLLHSVGRDVTDRKHAENALRASQSSLERTGRVAGVGGWELDLASQSISWSEQTRRIHEVGPDYVITLEGAIGFYAPDARSVIQEAVQNALDKGEPWDLELPFVTAKGRSIWVRAAGEVDYEDGIAIRLVGAFQDITQRKQLEQRLARSELFVREITDGLPIRIAYLDRDKRYQFVNQAHCQWFGRSREDILGCTLAELNVGNADSAGLANPQLEAALAGQVQHFEVDEIVNGETRRIEIQLIPDISNVGRVEGIFASGVDITERFSAEKSLRVLTNIFDNTTDFVVQTDWQGQITYMNPAVRLAAGLTASAPLDKFSFTQFNTPATNSLYEEVIVPAVKAHGVWVGETTVYGANQRVIPVSHMVIAHRGPNGMVERYSAVMRDISAEGEGKRQLIRQTATLRSVIEAIPALVTVVGSDEHYRFVNSAFARWKGMDVAQIVGKSLPEILGTEEFERSRPWVARVLAGETVAFEKEYTGGNAVNHMAISYVPLRNELGQIDGFVGVAQDISDHKREEVRLLQLTQRDPLTGLLNHAGFKTYLEHRIQEGSGPSLALLYIDLDHFKPVNDRYGHPVGDKLLLAFAQRMLKIVRPVDAVARLGGDEFAIVLSGVREISNVRLVANKVLEAAKSPFELDMLQITVGACVGISLGVDAKMGWQDLVDRADAMLYEAKRSGRGRLAGG